MSDRDASETIVRDYLDALLQDAPSAPPHADADADAGADTDADTDADAAVDAPGWLLCTLGRLQLLLPAAALRPAVACADVQAPATWHLARITLEATPRRVIDLARCVAPGLATAAVDTLLPVAGSDWVLAVAGRPQTAALPAEAIEWRQQRDSRPWLAGISLDRRQLALDVHGLIAEAAGDAGPAMEEPPS